MCRGKLGLRGSMTLSCLQGLPRQLATMDACRLEIGRAAAQIILDRNAEGTDDEPVLRTMSPTISYGDTLRRDRRV